MISTEDKISSSESEGAFTEFIEENLDSLVEGILSDGSLENVADRGSDIVVELDGIEPPRFVYEDASGGQGFGRGTGPGRDRGRMRFTLPFKKLMALIAAKLDLPNLIKEGEGRIKAISLEYKTFGQVGVILDKKRTFKRALRTNVATGRYAPQRGKYDIQITRRDKRYKLPEKVEKPRYRAVVFYMGDISYSTTGERLQLEKQIVLFIQNWLDYNYRAGNVEHRFFVHDVNAYEVRPEDFYRVSNAGGTQAAIVFDLIAKIALSEYDPQATNFYAFYFGDGELFDDDPQQILKIYDAYLRPWFHRVGLVEVLPGASSRLLKEAKVRYGDEKILRLAELRSKKEIIHVIKQIFGRTNAKR